MPDAVLARCARGVDTPPHRICRVYPTISADTDDLVPSCNLVADFLQMVHGGSAATPPSISHSQPCASECLGVRGSAAEDKTGGLLQSEGHNTSLEFSFNQNHQVGLLHQCSGWLL